MNIFRRDLLGRRGLVVFVALALTQFACNKNADPPPELSLDEPGLEDPADLAPGDPDGAEGGEEPAVDTAAPMEFRADFGLNIFHQPLCNGNSYAAAEGTIDGPVDALPGASVALRLYLDANGNFVYDEGEETGDAYAGELGADGSFLVGAPLLQFGPHGILFFSVGGIDLTERAQATGIFTVDDAEGTTATGGFEFTFDDGSPIVDTSAFAACP